MALKIGSIVFQPGAGVKGVDYHQHLIEKLVTKPTTAIVTTEKSVKGVKHSESSDSETLHKGVHNSGVSITVEGGRTLNLGNYESVRIGVSVTLPCEQNSLNEAYEFATDWISAKIEEAVKTAKGEV